MPTIRCLSILMVFTATAPPALGEALFSDLVVFGDSLSDNGNLFEITNGFVPESPPYYEGRFSNGPVWVEALAPLLGLDAETISDFAIGGLDTAGVLDFEVTPFVGDGPAAADALYVLWAGPNDFLGGVADPDAAVAQAVGNLSQSIDLLGNAGAVDLLVPNMPDLGATPRFVGGGDPDDAAAMTAITLAFNEALDDMIAGYGVDSGLNLISMDVFAALEQVVADPGAFGLTNVTEPALAEDGTIVPNPDEYMFWDDIHPTRVMHTLLGELAFGSVPEPATLLLFCGGAIGVLRRTRA